MKTTLEPQDFINFIGENHPDPDFAMREFNQLAILATEFAEAAVNAKLQELELYKNAVSKNPNEEYQDWQYDKDVDFLISLIPKSN